MKALRVILVDQLSKSISSLDGIDKKLDTIMLCEVLEEFTYVEHHPKKIAFNLASQRHFVEELKTEGYSVHYVKLDDHHNTGTLDGEINRAVEEIKPETVIITEPGEWRILEKLNDLKNNLSINIEIRFDSRFLCNINEFKNWARHKKQLRMEYFYREMRKKHNILINENFKPTGGKWNFDKENRKPLKQKFVAPKRISFKKDKITQDVLELVKNKFDHHFGDLKPFYFSVTRMQALKEVKHFMKKILPTFGNYQDAMVKGEPYLYHSLLSVYLNSGLLLPSELCRMAENEYDKGNAKLNSVEGFIRQILGWREFIRGIYWNFMPKYGSMNYFNAKNPLPASYWGAPTKMACIGEVIKHTKEHAYSHHIQRLMITGNFALIAGIDPAEVCKWYLEVYADAYEWVELPNTLGMSLFGDGGIIASKPYASSGKYINRMSDFCKTCIYDPDIMKGETACPFNALYWDFLIRNEKRLRGNQRMPFVFTTWDKFDSNKQKAIREQAKITLDKMSKNLL